jgi:sulfoxide reductase heme-binding subunit YedZ
VARAARRRAGRAAVLGLGLLPAAWLAAGLALDRLGADPVEALLHGSGDWALRLLLATLALTPLRRLGWRGAPRHRRTLGLLAFAYALVHFAVYVGLEIDLDLATLVEDVAERPFVTAGFTALLVMVPLAATSTRAAQRRLGRRWGALHRLVWLALAAALLHVVWGAKADLRGPLVYVAVAGLLLAARWRGRLPRRRKAPPGRPDVVMMTGSEEGSSE